MENSQDNLLEKQALDTLKEIENTSGTNAKIGLLCSHKDNPVLKDILEFSLNPYIRTGIGETKLNKLELGEISHDSDWNLPKLFDYLRDNNTGKDSDVANVKKFITQQDPQYQEILSKIFTKTLNIGISDKTVNKVWTDLVPSFGIQLAHRFEDYVDTLHNQTVFITEKLDGNRCFAKVENHICTFYTRSGRIMEGLDQIGEELSRLTDGWYDGELIAQSFNATQSQTLKKGKKKDLVFNIFDFLSLNEVLTQKCNHTYRERRMFLEKTVFLGIEKFKYVRLVPLIAAGKFDNDWIMNILDEYTSQGSEGIMLNLDRPYEFKRTENLIKVKKMYSLDLRVIDLEEGSGQNKGKLGNIVVNYKGYSVGVGSGFKKWEREYYWQHQEEIFGKIVEIKCFEETINKNGTKSLRFPVFVKIRQKDEESYD